MGFFYQSIQGNMGLGKAIEYFTSKGIPIAIPLNDTQPYDLIADFGETLQRVSVKTSRHHPSNSNISYMVQLRNTGGENRSRKNPFDNTSCDYIFIYTADEKCYLIPSNKITTTTAICVGGQSWKDYEVKSKTLQDLTNENVQLNGHDK